MKVETARTRNETDQEYSVINRAQALVYDVLAASMIRSLVPTYPPFVFNLSMVAAS